MNFKILHSQALAATKKIKTAECELIDILQGIDACRGFTEMGHTSLHVYVIKELKLSEACAYRLITVSRKATQVPELKEALQKGQLTLSNAVVIAPVLAPGNQAHWLDLAGGLTKSKLEREVAEVRPEAARKEKARPIGNKRVRLELDLSEEVHALLVRAQELLAQKKSKHVNMEETLGAMAQAFVKREDPVEKADRNAQNTRPRASSIGALHKVHARDRGSCQFKLPNGQLCGERKWIQLHHLKPRSEGGPDTPENLLTLCSGHHRIVHKRSTQAGTTH